MSELRVQPGILGRARNHYPRWWGTFAVSYVRGLALCGFYGPVVGLDSDVEVTCGRCLQILEQRYR